MRTAVTFAVLGLFDRGGRKTAFEHIPNLVIATILVAACFETVKHFDTVNLPGLSNPSFSGYLVAGRGCMLVALNFPDGLRKLARLRWHSRYRPALSIGYFFALRIVQLIIYFQLSQLLDFGAPVNEHFGVPAAGAHQAEFT